jgi:hypothetical protein
VILPRTKDNMIMNSILCINGLCLCTDELFTWNHATQFCEPIECKADEFVRDSPVSCVSTCP